MIWGRLGKMFAGVVLPLFLAPAPVILGVLADIGPPLGSASVISAVASGLVIACVCVSLKTCSETQLIKWMTRAALGFVVCLPVYMLIESSWVYKTDPPGRVRRVRGFIPVSADADNYITTKGSVNEALRGNDWESDGLFTESSKNIAKMIILLVWNVGFCLLCASIAAFVLRETKQHNCTFRDFLHAKLPGPSHEDGTSGPTQGPPSTRTILILASNPISTNRLRIDEEVKKIEQGLERARNRDQFRLVQRWAVTDDELRRALLDSTPEIVHFAGHGTGSGQGETARNLTPGEHADAGGLVFEDDSGRTQIISGDALARLFELCSDHVKCVVLNACYSEAQADAIARHIDNVVGMKWAIGDAAAIKFAVGFYDALGAGRDFEAAYKFGCSAIDLNGIPESLTPVYKRRA